MAYYMYDRHIIIVGKTGVGKSSVANQILDDDSFPVRTDFDSGTTKTAHSDAYLSYKRSTYKITLIDTVGLFDTVVGDNDYIIDDVKECIKANAPNGLNLVLFVVKNDRFTKEEHDTFQFIIDNLRDKIEDVSALVITRCDGMSQNARDDLITKFCESKATAKFAKFMKKGIYTVGFPDLKMMDSARIPALKEAVKKDREQLLDLIAKSSTKFLGDEIKNEGLWETVYKFCTIM